MSDTIRVDMGPAIRAIENVGQILQSDIRAVQGDVGKVRSDLELTADELRMLRRDFNEYVMKAERVANVQRSETRVGTLKDELDRQYGHYAVVRRTSVGMLQAFDVGNVSNETVTQVSEELMIQSPRYWLAPALVALAGWSRDDADMANKSVREAFSRDSKKTSLFFALVLRRQGRAESSVRWLRHYLMAMDPLKLGREFAVVLEAAAQNAFGPAGAELVGAQIREWNTLLRMDEAVVDAQVEKWTSHLSVHRMVVDSSQYATLASLSPSWGLVRSQLEAASAIPVAAEKYRGIATDTSAEAKGILDLLDDILEQLVTEYDEEELPLQRQVAFHEAVIEEDGDLDRARARSEIVVDALEETIDAVSLQTTAAISPEHLGVSHATQMVAIGTSQQDFRSAVGSYCAHYRKDSVDHVPIVLDGDHSNYAKTYKFSQCMLDTQMPEEAAFEQIDAEWNRAFREFIVNATFRNQWYVGRGLAALAATIIGFLIHPVAGVVLLLLGAGIVYMLGERKKKQAAALVQKAKDSRESAKEYSRSLFRDATAEFVDAQMVYKELDQAEGEMLSIIDAWPAGTATAESEVA